MRLIASFENEKQALAFHSLLGQEKIESNIEQGYDPESNKPTFLIWVLKEDDIDKAVAIRDSFMKEGKSFENAAPPPPKEEKLEDPAPPKAPEEEKREPPPQPVPNENEPIKGPIRVKAGAYYFRMRMNAPITRWIIILCSVLFLWNAYQKITQAQQFPSLKKYFSLTTLDMAFMYDVPKAFEQFKEFFEQHPEIDLEKQESWSLEESAQIDAIEKIPYFKGLYEETLSKNKHFFDYEMFRKIREGQVWRLFTPCVLHGDFLHILFNMLWLWLLGRQVEQKIRKGRFILLMLIIGIISNTFQYLMSGPFFLGYSGIVSGLGGFIWLRQKKAPWEGYNVPKATLIFLFLFIFAMLALQFIAYFMALLNIAQFNLFRIANTAHVSGLITGVVFAKIPYFYKVKR